MQTLLTLHNSMEFSWSMDEVKDEEKTELIYRVPCKNCSSSYIGETGRKFGLRIKQHKKEVDSFTAGTQTRASTARESSVTHKLAITDHAVKENHVIDWDKAKVVDREAQRQTRRIKEALWTRKTPKCMNRDAGSYQPSHTWDQVISRSRGPSSCKQSTRRDPTDIETLSLGNDPQLCRVRSVCALRTVCYLSLSSSESLTVDRVFRVPRGTDFLAFISRSMS